jgi:hypothetical protein
VGKFARDTIAWQKVVVCNELQDLETGRTNWDAMKARITEDTITTRRLYENDVVLPNVDNYIILSNNIESVKIALTDRRYFVLDVNNAHCNDHAYFQALHAEIGRPQFLPALLQFFLSRDIKNYRCDRPPRTELAQQIAKADLSSVETWAAQFRFTPDEAQSALTAKELYARCDLWFCEHHQERRYFPRNVVSFALKIRRFFRVESGPGHAHLYYPLSNA